MSGYSFALMDFSVQHACGHWVEYLPEDFDAVFGGYDEDDEDGPAGEPCPACREAGA